MRKRRWQWLGLGAAALVAIVGWQLLQPPPPTVRFFDVGQGDAALVSSGRTQLLVDGGPDRSGLAPLGAALPPLDRRIEYVVLTHPHTDHYRGLLEVVRRYRVGTLLVGVPGVGPEYRNLIDEARRRGVRIVRAARQQIAVGQAIRADVIYPPEAWPDKPVSDPNNSSVVVMVSAPATKVLMVGDTGNDEERELLGAGLDLDADILKVGHHGSRTSSGPDFLAAVTPRVAVISVGAKNRYGHPAPATIQRLQQTGATIYRTDQRGTVTVTFSAAGYRLRTDR